MAEEEMDEQLELMEDYDPWDDDDYCYECGSYGDDYYIDEDGELQSRCQECSMNSHRDYWEDWE